MPESHVRLDNDTQQKMRYPIRLYFTSCTAVSARLIFALLRLLSAKSGAQRSDLTPYKVCIASPRKSIGRN
jgi:hypothetical protein